MPKPDEVPPGFVRLALTGAIVPSKHSPDTTLTGAIIHQWRPNRPSAPATNRHSGRAQPKPPLDTAPKGNPLRPPSIEESSPSPPLVSPRPHRDEPRSVFSDLMRRSLLERLGKVETCRPKRAPFREAKSIVSDGPAGLINYAKDLISYLQGNPRLTATNQNYLQLFAAIFRRESADVGAELDRAIDLFRMSNPTAVVALSLQAPSKFSLPAKPLAWQILPPGKWTFGEVRAHFTEVRAQAVALEWDLSRLTYAQKFKPNECWVGQGELSGYVVFVFLKRKLALLDHPIKGNACYILKGDWRSLSRLTKWELLAKKRRYVKRIVHRGDWRQRLKIELG